MKNFEYFSFKRYYLFLVVFLLSTVSLFAYPADNCSPTPNVTCNTPCSASGLGLSATPTNQVFILNADFTIDQATDFNNCLFLIAPGVEIIITTSNWVIFEDCNLFNCSGKWDGIRIQTSSNAKLWMTGSKLENSIYGINMDAKTNVSLHVNTTDFYNNHIGIYIKNYCTFLNDFVWGNHFHGDAQSWGHGNPALQQLPAYGIKVDGASNSTPTVFRVGRPDVLGTVKHNEFYELYIAGVYGEFLEGTISGSTFINFWPVSPSATIGYAPIMGSGVTLYDSDVTITNTPTSSAGYPRILFELLNYGVYSKVSSYMYLTTEVYDAKFMDCASWCFYGNASTGLNVFKAEDCEFRQTQFNTHPFYTSSTYFNCAGLDGGSWFVMYRCEFYSNQAVGMNGQLNYQVYLNGAGAGTGAGTAANIRYCGFWQSIDNGVSIFITNSSGSLIVDDNDFYPWIYSGAVPDVTWQLTGLDSRGLDVKDNFLLNDFANDAIHISGLYDSRFCVNETYGNIYGLHALDDSNIDFAQTYFGDSEIAIFLDKPGSSEPIIGMQFEKDNEFCETYFVQDADNQASTPTLVDMSRFDCRPTGCYLPTAYSPLPWFTPDGKDPNTCEEENFAQLFLQETEIGNMTWERTYEWYNTIAKRGPVNDLETDFLASLAETSIPELVQIENSIIDINNVNNDNHNDFEVLKSQASSIKVQISNILVNYIGFEPTGADSIAVQDLSSELLLINSQLEDLRNQAISNDISASMGILSELNNLQTSNDQESTYKDYLGLILNVHMNGFTQENYDLAISISEKDFTVYGHGAKKANHFLPHELYQDYLFELSLDCNPSENAIGPKEKVHQTVAESWMLNKTGINQYNLINNCENCKSYIVYNMSGAEILKGKLEKGNNSINLAVLNIGYYIIRTNGDSKIEKILIEN